MPVSDEADVAPTAAHAQLSEEPPPPVPPLPAPQSTQPDAHECDEPHDPFADEHFDRAFTSFMGSEADVEPSRHWMISGE
jgi:hypothetical protein